MRALGGLAAAVRSGLRPIAACALAGALVGLAWGLADEPEYAATATVIINDRGAAADALGNGTIGGEGPDASDRLLELARSEEVARLAAASLGSDVPGADLLAQTDFRTGDRGGTLVIRSVAGFPDYAAAAANAFAGAVVETANVVEERRLERARERFEEALAAVDPASEEGLRLSENLAAVDSLEAVDDPLRPGREADLPSSPEHDRSALAGALAGLGIGAAVALLLGGLKELRRRPVRTTAQLEAATGREVRGVFGRDDAAVPTRRAGILTPESPASDRAEALMRALHLDRQDGPAALTVASPMPGEGRTSVALGLVGAAAAAGVNVLLMEADMRRPALAGLLGIQDEPGLSDYLAGAASPREVINAIPVAGGAPGTEPPSFVCVTAGGELDAPGPMLSGPRFRGLVDQLRRVYDVVIFDSPALLPAPEAILISEVTDTTVLCARAGLTRRRELREAREKLRSVDVSATVLTGAAHAGRDVRRLPLRGGTRFAEPRMRR